VDQRDILHHLLGAILPTKASKLSPSSFRSLATATIVSIDAYRCVLVVAAGSNSLIHTFLAY
jgi:tRNA A37 N6-isopentenylltransferase MiaA